MLTLSYSVVKSLFINLDDNAFENAEETSVAVKRLLNSPEWLKGYIADIQSDLDMSYEDLEETKSKPILHFLIEKEQKFCNHYQKCVNELTSYYNEKFPSN